MHTHSHTHARALLRLHSRARVRAHIHMLSENWFLDALEYYSNVICMASHEPLVVYTWQRCTSDNKSHFIMLK